LGPGGEQELNAEVTEEIGLIAAAGFEAASGHEKKDHRWTEFVASAEIYGGLVLGRMESSLGIELHVAFEFWGEIVADHETGEPSVRSFVDKLIPDFVIHVAGPNFLENSKGRRKTSLAGVMPRWTASLGLLRNSWGKSETERPDSPAS
jgi:hypothetical protein